MRLCEHVYLQSIHEGFVPLYFDASECYQVERPQEPQATSKIHELLHRLRVNVEEEI